MSVYYSPETIKLCRNRYVEIAMKNGTPKRYAGMLYEAAEIIAQLQRELKLAQVERKVLS